MIEKQKRPVALNKLVSKLNNRELRKFAHGAFVSIRTRSRNKNVSAGKISSLEKRIFLRCKRLHDHFEQLEYSGMFRESSEYEEVLTVVGRILKRSLDHTYRDGALQESVGYVVSTFENHTGIIVSVLPG
ncbi:MAG: hypothetical protein V4524_00610 [Patescibacteria group bacterium]